MVRMLRAAKTRGPSYDDVCAALERLVNAATEGFQDYEPNTRGKNEWLRSLLQAKETLRQVKEARG